MTAAARVRTALVASVVGAGLLVGCGGAHPARPRSAPVAMTVPALDGGELDLASLRGKVVVIHAFTTWSVAAQLDVEQRGAAGAADDVVVVGLALDADGRVLVAPWRAAGDVTYLVALADDAIRAGRSVLGPLPEVPTTFVLDGEGRIVTRVERQLGPGELARLIAAARI